MKAFYQWKEQLQCQEYPFTALALLFNIIRVDSIILVSNGLILLQQVVVLKFLVAEVDQLVIMTELKF